MSYQKDNYSTKNVSQCLKTEKTPLITDSPNKSKAGFCSKRQKSVPGTNSPLLKKKVEVTVHEIRDQTLIFEEEILIQIKTVIMIFALP